MFQGSPPIGLSIVQTFPSGDKVISNSKFNFNSVSTDDELLDVPSQLTQEQEKSSQLVTKQSNYF